MRMSKKSVSVLMMIAALMRVITLVCSLVSVVLLWKIASGQNACTADMTPDYTKRMGTDDPDNLDDLCF